MILQQEPESQPPGTVSVVDDDDQLRESLRLLLMTVGFRVEAFASAEEFLQRHPLDSAGAPPVCLIVDLHMPGMGGLRLLEQLSMQQTPPTVIILTAHADRRSVARARKANVFGILEKPCPGQKLIDCVYQAIAHNARQ